MKPNAGAAPDTPSVSHRFQGYALFCHARKAEFTL